MSFVTILCRKVERIKNYTALLPLDLAFIATMVTGIWGP